MSLKRCPWKRFWCPVGGRILLADGGFPCDPDVHDGLSLNPDLVPAERIRAFPCLVLLGEPGIGKSVALQEIVEEVRARVAPTRDAVLQLNLAAYGSEDRLCRALFESDVFRAWERGDHGLHVFLDSLDEGLIRISAIGAILAEELASRPIARLWLRVACRTAEWPRTLGDAFTKLWGEGKVGTYELAPLLRKDIQAATVVHELDPVAFLAGVFDSNAQPFAFKPTTLELLINLFRTGGALPDRAVELYERGLMVLCEESETRTDSRLRSRLDAAQRLAVASRVAACLVLANRGAVYTAPDRGDVPPEDVCVADLVGGHEGLPTHAAAVDETAIRDVLNTALFSSRGSARLGFAHQTYAEFLAARYLVRHTFGREQINSLMSIPGERGLYVAPQLHETASWLASLDATIFADLIESEPEILIRGDVATADPVMREGLAEHLLRRVGEGAIADWPWDHYRYLKKLAHPGLELQLRTVIKNEDGNHDVRRAAIYVAEACRLSGLSDDLAAVALDETEPLALRVGAAHALADMGNSTARARLKLLALGQAGEDPDDDLRGVGLQATWPEHLSVDELFTCLVPAKKPAYAGHYYFFVTGKTLPDALEPRHLPTALDWLLRQDSQITSHHYFEELADGIVLRAWHAIGAPGIPERLGRALLGRLKRHEAILKRLGDDKPDFAQMVRHDTSRRRQLLEAVVGASVDERDMVALIFSRPPLLVSEDFPWSVEKALSADENAGRKWAELAHRTFDMGQPSHLQLALDAKRRSRVLAAVFNWPEAVKVDSPEGRKAKKDHARYQRLMRNRETKLLDPPPEKRVASVLERCLAGEPELWPWLDKQMTLEPKSTHYRHDPNYDVRDTPGWRNADEPTRQRVLLAARLYVEHHRPDVGGRIGTDRLCGEDYARHRSLKLLIDEDPSFLEGLPTETWRKLAPAVLGISAQTRREGNDDGDERIVAVAYRRAPEKIIATLLGVIDAENERHGHLFVLHRIERCWDDRISAALLGCVRRGGLRPECVRALLGALLLRQIHGARELAEGFVTRPPPQSNPDREVSVQAACCLIACTADAGWNTVWPAVCADSEWGKAVFGTLCESDRGGWGEFVNRRSAAELGTLFDWLVQLYPYESDPPPREGAFFSGIEDHMRELRGDLLRNLEQHGTIAACAELRRLQSKHSELSWLRQVVARAEAVRRRQAWVPAKPRHIIEMATDRQKRFIESGHELLDALCESLRRLQSELHGETPEIESLWDKLDGKTLKPKDEAALSNYVKNHLKRDLKWRGIIVNREVEIRRRIVRDGEPGERTDIHVDAVARSETGVDELDVITAIMEVKGCWHRELKDAMQTQLVGRYMRDSGCRHGLYLVGWFLCEAWRGDHKRKRRTFASIDECRDTLAAQASELSGPLFADSGEVRTFVLDCRVR